MGISIGVTWVSMALTEVVKCNGYRKCPQNSRHQQLPEEGYHLPILKIYSISFHTAEPGPVIILDRCSTIRLVG